MRILFNCNCVRTPKFNDVSIYAHIYELRIAIPAHTHKHTLGYQNLNIVSIHATSK